MTSRSRLWILGFALLGLGFASASSWVHYKLLTDPTYVSPCDMSATFNCSQAYLSRYGSVWGVPVALGGVLWFALVALIAGLARTGANDDTSDAGAYVFGLSVIGLAVVMYLGYASYFRLHTLCVLCMGTYVSVIAIFLISARAQATSVTQLPGRMPGDLKYVLSRPLLIVLALLYLGSATTMVLGFPRGATAAPVKSQALPVDFEKQFTEAWAQQPRIDLGVKVAGAKVIIVKFNDFLCPMCKSMESAYKPILEKYAAANPGAVALVLKDWPWNKDCNFAIVQGINGHQNSCRAAVAARIARDQGKFDEMRDWLFSQQELLIEDGMNGSKKGPGLIAGKVKELTGVADFEKQYQARLDDIQRDIADGKALGVGSTPTYFVNGVQISSASGIMRPDVLDLAIKIELASKSKDKAP
jgi:uncharacterized membrane protein/protein-disulfide isomerase